MNHFEKVKNFLLDMGHEITQENAEDNMFLINNEGKGLCNMMLDCEGDILVMEQHMFDLNGDSKEAYKRLLQMNRKLVHGAFVLDEEGKRVLFRDTLALTNIDFNELESSVNSLTIALAENADEFMQFARK